MIAAGAWMSNYIVQHIRCNHLFITYSVYRCQLKRSSKIGSVHIGTLKYGRHFASCAAEPTVKCESGTNNSISKSAIPQLSQILRNMYMPLQWITTRNTRNTRHSYQQHLNLVLGKVHREIWWTSSNSTDRIHTELLYWNIKIYFK